jgi:hypothetical protein
MNAPGPADERRFAATTFLITGGLLIWLTNFTFVYVFAALACARNFARVQIAGLAIVPIVTTFATLSAAIATAVLIAAARRRRRASDQDPHSRFIDFVVLATSGIALVVLVWLAFPPLMTSGCRDHQFSNALVVLKTEGVPAAATMALAELASKKQPYPSTPITVRALLQTQ